MIGINCSGVSGACLSRVLFTIIKGDKFMSIFTGASKQPERILETASRSEMRRIVAGGVAGQIVEFYDYALYGMLAASIGRIFFPSEDPAIGILSAFAVFGVANVMRPLGGLILGPLGDRVGRRTILVISVTIISIATFLVGVLPGEAAIGIAAPILLVLLRLAQGFSAGGELISVVTYVAEHAPVKRRGFYTAFLQSGATFSFLLASSVVLVVTTMVPAEAFDVWGWRIPFLLALPLGGVAIYLRLRLEESPVFVKLRSEGQLSKTPLREALTKTPRLIIQGIMVVALTFSANFVFLSYFPTYLKEQGFSSQDAFMATTIGLSLSVVVHPLVGLLSDYLGRKQVAVGASVFFVLLSWPMFAMLASGSLGLVILALGIMTIGLGGGVAVVICFFTEFTSSRTRMATFAIGYNIGGAVFGAPVLFVVQLLVIQTGDPRSPAFYLIGAALVSLITLLTIRSYAKPGDALL
jgi:MHS family proline/betaine transporter-like MFS transporter